MGLKARPLRRDDFAVGQVYRYALDDGQWTACQLIDLDDDKVEMLALNLLTAEPPSLADAAGAPPLGGSYGGVRGLARQVRRQRYWDQVPQAARDAYAEVRRVGGSVSNTLAAEGAVDLETGKAIEPG